MKIKMKGKRAKNIHNAIFAKGRVTWRKTVGFTTSHSVKNARNLVMQKKTACFKEQHQANFSEDNYGAGLLFYVVGL